MPFEIGKLKLESGLFEGFVEKIEKNLSNDLAGAKIVKNPKVYLHKAFSNSLLCGIALWLVAGLFTGKIVSSAFCGLAFSAIVFGAFLYFPKMRKKKIASLIERDLPFALASMSAELNMGVSFEKCLSNAASGDYGLVSGEFKSVTIEIFDCGFSVQEALLHSSERIDSLMFKRAIAQLVNIYEQGSKKDCGEAIKKIAREILSRQKAESEEFSGKLVVFSLLFIAVSAIVPAIFQAFIIVGSFFLKIKFTPLQIILIITIGFPLIDFLVFYYIKSKTPVFLEG